jgi:hypothetical protein
MEDSRELDKRVSGGPRDRGAQISSLRLLRTLPGSLSTRAAIEASCMSRFRTWKDSAWWQKSSGRLGASLPGGPNVECPGVYHAGLEMRACTVVTLAKPRAAVVHHGMVLLLTSCDRTPLREMLHQPQPQSRGKF